MKIHYFLLSKFEAFGNISCGPLCLLRLLLYVKYITKPIAIHASAVSWVVLSNEMIIAPQTNTPKVETTGTIGTLKGLTTFGCFTLMIHTPIQTSTKANSVPILVKSPVISPGNNVAKPPTNRNNIQFDLKGVLNFLCKSENAPGNKPSWDIE